MLDQPGSCRYVLNVITCVCTRRIQREVWVHDETRGTWSDVLRQRKEPQSERIMEHRRMLPSETQRASKTCPTLGFSFMRVNSQSGAMSRSECLGLPQTSNLSQWSQEINC